MNNIKIVKESKDNSLSMGQIYEYGTDFYIIAKKNLHPEGCLINLRNGNLYSYAPVEDDLKDPRFVLFRGTLEIQTIY